MKDDQGHVVEGRATLQTMASDYYEKLYTSNYNRSFVAVVVQQTLDANRMLAVPRPTYSVQAPGVGKQAKNL